jgi:zinc transporter ZupT
MIYFALFIAVFLGYGVAILLKEKKAQQLSLPLAFSGAFLLAVTLFELLPQVYQSSNKYVGPFVMVGILLQICLEFLSKGAEHGHVHLHDNKRSFPWLLFCSLSIHALFEGFPIAEHTSMFVGVLVHKIPIAMILSVFFIKAKYPLFTILSFLFLFASMTPLGSWLSVNSPDVMVFKNELNAISIGIFLHVSTTILFESSKDHKFNLAKLSTIIAAIIIAYFI